jgi:hypothetical protein
MAFLSPWGYQDSGEFGGLSCFLTSGPESSGLVNEIVSGLKSRCKAHQHFICSQSVFSLVNAST